MSAAPRRRLEAIQQQIAPSRGTFEDIPRIRKIAADIGTPRCKDKVVIITGCNSPLGIGRATAHLYAANGAQAIYICDFAEQHLATHVREITSLYPSVEVHARRFDASDEQAVEAIVKEVIDQYGRLDVFFANAGIVGNPTTFEHIEADAFMDTMKINVLSVFLALKHAAPAMKITSSAKPYPSGSIISTASVAGIRSNAGSSDYSASKAAVINLMQTGSYQLARTDIRCNAICPGLIETGMTAPVFDGARARGTEGKIGQINPMGRGAVADEVAQVALFLGTDEASYVNGQAIAVCGGLSAGHPYVLGKLA